MHQHDPGDLFPFLELVPGCRQGIGRRLDHRFFVGLQGYIRPYFAAEHQDAVFPGRHPRRHDQISIPDSRHIFPLWYWIFHFILLLFFGKFSSDGSRHF